MDMCEGNFRLDVMKRLFTKVSGQALELAHHCSDHRIEPDGVQEAFVQCSQKYGLILGWSCVEPEVEFNCPCESHLTWDILYLYDSKNYYKTSVDTSLGLVFSSSKLS